MRLHNAKPSQWFTLLHNCLHRILLVFAPLLAIWLAIWIPRYDAILPVYAQNLDTYVANSGNDTNSCSTLQSPCKTIQAAINKTATGGAVHVAPGAYYENITMKSGVSVIGASPTTTSIMGSASTAGVVLFSSVVNARLEGFRITVTAAVPGTDRAIVFSGTTDRSAVLRNNIIQNTQYGIFVWTPSAPTIENNTLVGGPDEQGIYIGNYPTAPLIRNNIITGYYFAGIHVVAGAAAPLPVILYNDLWNNTENYHSYPDQTGVNGNQAVDPLFVNPTANDFHLRSTPPASPAIDAGDPTSAYGNEPMPNGARINMGAYGNTPEAEISTALEDYAPVAELIDPSGSLLETRAIEEKDGFAYLLTRTGKLHIYNILNLPTQTGFTTYNVPIASRTLSNGDGLLRNGDYVYVFGGSGLEILNAQNASAPTVIGSRYDFPIYNLIQHTNLLIAVGPELVGVYSVANPASPNLLSTYSLGTAQNGFSAAVYADVIYVSQFQSGNTNMGISIIDFSDPAHLSLIRFISRSDTAYHLWVLGDKLVECNSDSLGMWSLSTPANPSFQASVAAEARVCARVGNHIVTNGEVFTVAGSSFNSVAIFDPAGDHFDGRPYGSAVNSNFVFLAQSERILILRRPYVQPCYTLTLSHAGSGANPVAAPAKSAHCSSDGQYIIGEAISLSASPAAGWQVGNWTGTNNDASTAITNTIIMPADNHTVRVAYTALCYRLTPAHSGAGNDPVATPTHSSGCPANYYVYGESISVHAVAATGWWVGSWIGTNNDTATSLNNVVIMPATDHRVIVNYIITCYPLVLTHSGSGSDPLATPAQSATCPAGQYIAGEAISVHAAPITGWRVVGWSGVTVTTAPSTDNTLIMPASTHTVNVNYEQMPVTVTGDAYEEDNLCAQARTINADGVGQAHSFHRAADEDWVQFAAVANVPYRVEVNIPTGSPADVILMVYEQCAAGPIDQFDADFAPGARLDFTATTTAPIYVRLSNKDTKLGGANATYQVAVRSLNSATAETNRAVILVGGSLTTPDRLQSNISHVTDAVYAYFLANGYKAEEILYLTNDANVAKRTGAATLDALQAAITVWAKQRLTVGGTLTLYLMDHGDADAFYVDNANAQVLTPEQLDGWLDQLEAALPEAKVTIIMEACYSGSFIEGEQSISKDEPGRLVLTSTSDRLMAYASSSGAYFSDFMLATLEQGYSLHNSFKATYAVVREMSALRQDPWLDGNGNGIPNEPADIMLSTQRANDTGGQGWAPYIVSIQPPTVANQRAILQAIVRDDKKVRRVWAVITPPSYRSPEKSTELVAEPLPTLVLLEKGNDTFAAEYPGFDELGRYRIAIYAEDEENLVTLPKLIEVITGNRVFLPLIRR